MRRQSENTRQDGGSSSPDPAEEDFARRKRIHYALAGGDEFAAERDDNAYLGQNILREEIGYFDDKMSALQPYNFDQETRDKLLAHGRQDIASTYAHALSSFKYAFQAFYQARRAYYISLLVLVISIANFVILARMAFGSD